MQNAKYSIFLVMLFREVSTLHIQREPISMTLRYMFQWKKLVASILQDHPMKRLTMGIYIESMI
ncbi:hypothetical protein CK226_03850 [Mesorhizobium sp. WSM4311]|nr:hypothetical protein CK226_03850 [Mesorhizobium sp. WSM4311]